MYLLLEKIKLSDEIFDLKDETYNNHARIVPTTTFDKDVIARNLEWYIGDICNTANLLILCRHVERHGHIGSACRDQGVVTVALQ